MRVQAAVLNLDADLNVLTGLVNEARKLVSVAPLSDIIDGEVLPATNVTSMSDVQRLVECRGSMETFTETPAVYSFARDFSLVGSPVLLR
jgi:hypothetical protein